MKRWRMMLLGVCLLVSACANTRDFYEAVYNTLQLQAKTKNLPDNSPYTEWPESFRQYEAERETLLKFPVKSTKSSP